MSEPVWEVEDSLYSQGCECEQDWICPVCRSSGQRFTYFESRFTSPQGMAEAESRWDTGYPETTLAERWAEDFMAEQMQREGF